MTVFPNNFRDFTCDFSCKSEKINIFGSKSAYAHEKQQKNSKKRLLRKFQNEIYRNHAEISAKKKRNHRNFKMTNF